MSRSQRRSTCWESIINLKRMEVYDKQMAEYNDHLDALKKLEMENELVEAAPEHLGTPPDPEQESEHAQHSTPPKSTSPPKNIVFSNKEAPPNTPQSNSPLQNILSPPSQSPASITASAPEHATRTDANPTSLSMSMEEFMELFETLQAKRAKEAERQPTVEAMPVMGPERRAEPLYFLTLGTVEGIVGSTSQADHLTEQTTWNAKLEKFMSLSETYSPSNTISNLLSNLT
jgi:hypothetical protein